MTIKQKQWQLFYLGYYGETTDDIDGYWGPKSEEATREFQEAVGIKVDGIFGNHTCAKSKEMVAVVWLAISRSWWLPFRMLFRLILRTGW